jgi:hypothetical protein
MLLHDVIQTKKSFSPGSQELNNEAKMVKRWILMY